MYLWEKLGKGHRGSYNIISYKYMRIYNCLKVKSVCNMSYSYSRPLIFENNVSKPSGILKYQKMDTLAQSFFHIISSLQSRIPCTHPQFSSPYFQLLLGFYPFLYLHFHSAIFISKESLHSRTSRERRCCRREQMPGPGVLQSVPQYNARFLQRLVSTMVLNLEMSRLRVCVSLSFFLFWHK